MNKPEREGPTLEDLIAALVAQQRDALILLRQIASDQGAILDRLPAPPVDGAGAGANGHAAHTHPHRMAALEGDARRFRLERPHEQPIETWCMTAGLFDPAQIPAGSIRPGDDRGRLDATEARKTARHGTPNRRWR